MTQLPNPTNEQELREKLLSLYSANFNDGEPVENRVNSRDMYSVSVVVDFIDDFVVPLINAEIAKVLDRLESEMNRYIAEHDAPMRDEAIDAIQSERNKLTMANSPQLDKLKERDDE